MPLILTAGLLGYGLLRKKPVLIGSAALGTLGLVISNRTMAPETTSRHEARASFAINCTAERAYRMWRDFANLPKFMRHLSAVTVLENGQSQWVASGPFGSQIRWSAEIIDAVENQRIAWRSIPGSQVVNQGSIEFRSVPGQRGILANLRMEYAVPAGAAGRALAALTGKHPEFTIKEDLRRFKALLEAGEVPTTAGQPHGPRGIHGRVLQVLLRERSNTSLPTLSMSQRRTA